VEIVPTYLDPAKLRFFRHGDALRVTIAEDRSCLRVSLVRCFPLSYANHYLSLRDGKNEELGILRDPTALSSENRQLVEEELHRRYMVPVVRKVTAVKDRYGVVEWEVETDRGARRFYTRDLRELASRPAPGRFILRDVEGNCYDVADIAALDAKSQARLLAHL